MGKYDPLSAHLAGLAPVLDSCRLQFGEMDELLGSVLPGSARSDRTWWANTQSSNHARAWLSAGWKVARVDFAGGGVIFTRSSAPTKRAERRASFLKLQDFFKSLDARQEQIALTLNEIEAITERKLRRTPKHDRTWWANTAKYEPAKYWMSAGWRVEAVYLRAQVIVFRRAGTAVLDTIRRWVKRLLEGDGTVGGPDAQTLADWIRECKRLRWFFEGTVLYERSGCAFDTLSEEDRTALEEDYDVCRREITRHKQPGAPSMTGASAEGITNG